MAMPPALMSMTGNRWAPMRRKTGADGDGVTLK
jgi:hypothetical protein